MTLLPAPQVDIEKAEGEKYEVFIAGLRCANPYCDRIADHRHHIVRRSALGGPYAWVKIKGVQVGNVTGLCWHCHARITDNQVQIAWKDDKDGNRGFFINDKLLNPHPPTLDWTPAEIGTPTLTKSTNPCRRCQGSGQEPPKEDPEWTEEEGGEKLKTVYAVRIPKAELSFGHKQLTTLIREAGGNLKELGYDEKTPPYYILSAVLFDWNEGR